jgi:NADPH:quinone reductase-like Zn-dependent oxidoreductase
MARCGRSASSAPWPAARAAAALLPGPLVIRILARTGEKVDSMVILGRPWRKVADQYGCDVSGVLQAAAPVVERRTDAQRVGIQLLWVSGA